MLVPFTLNLIGLILAAITGHWLLAGYLYYPLAFAIVLAAAFDLVPRARLSTRNEGAEKAWFYVAIWTMVPTQIAAWAAWRFGGGFHLSPAELNNLRLAVFVIVGISLLLLGVQASFPDPSAYFLIPDSARPLS